VEECEGGPRKWAQTVLRKNGQRHLSLPVFSHSFFLCLLLTPVRPRLRPLPPPSRPNASRRWFFLYFRHVTHHHRLPRVQTRAGGGVFRSFHRFDASPTTSTSLASKCEPEVVFFRTFDTSPTTTASLASKREPEAVFFVLSTHHGSTTTTTSLRLTSKREPEVRLDTGAPSGYLDPYPQVFSEKNLYLDLQGSFPTVHLDPQVFYLQVAGQKILKVPAGI